MNSRAIELLLIVVVAALAVYFGTTIATEEIVPMMGWLALLVAILFLVKGYKYSLELIFGIAAFNINFMLGFRLEPEHIAATIFLLHFFWTHLLKLPSEPNPTWFSSRGLSLLNLVIIFYLCYGAIHFFMCRAFPKVPGDFSLGNSAKAYFKAFMPFVIILIGLNSRCGFNAGPKIIDRVFLLLFAALGFNLAYLIYLYLNGFQSATAASNVGDINLGWQIPLINAVPHHFTMRELGPFGTLFSYSFITEKAWFKSRGKFVKVIVFLCLLFSIAGAAMSGGRAALLLAIFFVLVVSIVRRKVVLVATGTMVAMVIVLLANLFSDVINEDAPVFVARPFQYVMLDKGHAMDTIESSTNQRTALYEAAIDEWWSDTRTLFFGRGVYAYKYSFDVLRPLVGEENAFVEVNLRAGTCHAVVPSCLIQYGAFGLAVYFLIHLSIIIFGYRVYRRLSLAGFTGVELALSIVVLLYVSAQLAITWVAGDWLNLYAVTALLLLRACVTHNSKLLEAPNIKPAV